MASAAAAIAKPKPPYTQNPQEDSMDLWWDAIDGATSILIEARLLSKGQEWKDARKLELSGDATKCTMPNLLPTSTYEFRLTVTTAAGTSEPSDGMTADTLVANCGPKKSGSSGPGCSIQ